MSEPLPEARREAVEVWTFVSPHGASVSYEIRPDFGEKGQLLYNAIDHTPVSVELSFKGCDDKNEALGVMSFPVANCFSYGMARGEKVVYLPGQSPVERELKAREDRRTNSLLAKRERIQALMGDDELDLTTA